MVFEIENGILKKYHGDDENITIPDSVCKIGNRAFSYCQLKSIIVPDRVTELGSEVFYECGNLQSVTLGRDITKLGDYSFLRCCALEHLELPEGLEEVALSAFLECYSLSKAWVNGIEYRLTDSNAPKPVKLVLDSIMYGKQKVEDYYNSGAMDEFEYIDYCIAGDGYSI